MGPHINWFDSFSLLSQEYNSLTRLDIFSIKLIPVPLPFFLSFSLLSSPLSSPLCSSCNIHLPILSLFPYFLKVIFTFPFSSPLFFAASLPPLLYFPGHLRHINLSSPPCISFVSSGYMLSSSFISSSSSFFTNRPCKRKHRKMT